MIGLMLAAITAASPAPSPSAEPLKTIVTVKSSPLCGEFATHANAAIGSTVRNDASLGAVILTLRSADLSQNSVSRSNEEQRLSSIADAIYREYRSGMNEVNRLRDLANKATDATEKAELKASADALGGALYRQHLIQRDLDGFVAFLDTADMRSVSPDDQRNNAAMIGNSVGGYQATARGPVTVWVPNSAASQMFNQQEGFAGDESTLDDVRLGALASHDFQQRVPAIMNDEVNAAGHIEQASNGC